MRRFIDECLSPDYAVRLGARGHDAVHPLHVGRRGQLDHTVLAHCIAEDRAIVTENIGDFKALLGREPIHPGLIALPSGGKEDVWANLEAVIAFLEGLGGEPMDHLVNACLEFVEGAACAFASGQAAQGRLNRRFPVPSYVDDFSKGGTYARLAAVQELKTPSGRMAAVGVPRA